MNLNRVCNVEDWKLLGLDDSPKRRKSWEVELAYRSLSPIAKAGAEILGVGAGTEETIFRLCNDGARVWATDLYADAGSWNNWASANMMIDPVSCAPYPFNEKNLVVQHMDMRELRFHDNTFDGVFSSGSIEHIGTFDDVARASAEIGRVLKLGGILTLSTEWLISGDDHGWDGVLLFDENLIHQHIIEPSGLEVIGKLETFVSQPTLDTKYPLSLFVEAFNTRRMLANDDVVLQHQTYTFTSIHLHLQKSKTRGRGKK